MPAAIALFRDTRSQESELRNAVAVADPVWPNAPPATAFAPLVFLLVAVTPFLHAAAHAWLTPDAAAWGLRGLDVISAADWRQPGEPGRPTPPVLPWCLSVLLALPGTDAALAPALLTAFFGVGSCMLLGRLGMVWYSPAVGLVAAFLLAFNGLFLDEIRTGGDGPAVCFFALAGLVSFAEHLARQDSIWSRWTILGTAALAGLSLVAGWFAVWLTALGVVALAYRYAAARRTGRYIVEHVLTDSTMHAGLTVLAAGVALAIPWWIQSGFQSGPYSPWPIPHVGDFAPTTLSAVFAVMPAVTVLGAAGLLRSLREIWKLGPEAEVAALPAAWIVIAALALATVQPTAGAGLVLAAALIVSAANFLLELLARRTPDGFGTFALFATIAAVLLGDVQVKTSAAALGDFGFAVIVGLAILALGVLIFNLWNWSADRDEFRRVMLGGLTTLAFLLALTPGLARLRAPARGDDPWNVVAVRIKALINARTPDLAVVFDATALATPPRYDARTAAPRFLIRTLLPNVEIRYVNSMPALSAAVMESRNPMVLVFAGRERLGDVLTASAGSRTTTLVERLRRPNFAAYTATEAPAAP